MQQAGYHHANFLAKQLRADIAQYNKKLITVIQSAMDTASTAPSLTQSVISLATPTVAQPQVNYVQGDPV